ncbi:MAG: MATE family efflux transporter [Pseudomonadota bacterium]
MSIPEALPAPGWQREALHLARSGGTLAFNQLFQLAVPFMTTAMTGRLGVETLAAGSIVGSIGLLLLISALGVMQGLIPPLSSSLGAGDHPAAARTVRGGLAVAMGLAATAIMASVPWGLATAGFDATFVATAQRYIDGLLPAYLPSIGLIAVRFFLIGANDLRWLNAIIIVSTAFNAALNLWLAGGRFGLDGMTAIGITVSLTAWLTLGLLMLAIARSKRMPRGMQDWRAGFSLRDALRLGIPVGAVFFTEALLFTGSNVLMGYVGKVELATHGIVLLWLNIVLMIPVGVSQAAMARVASLHGQGDLEAMRQAALVSLVAGAAISTVIGVLLAAGSDSVVKLTLWSRSAAGEDVVPVARDFFRFCAVTQLLSGLIIVMASILRGLRDANAVLWLVMLGYWGVGLGGAVLFAFGFGLGGRGIWMGITLAFVFAVVLLALRFQHALHRAKDRGLNAAALPRR